MNDEKAAEEELNVPPDVPLQKAKPAEDSPIKRPGAKLVTQEYLDERMAALSNLMKTSMEPAIALMPISKRKEITAAFDNFEALVNE